MGRTITFCAATVVVALLLAVMFRPAAGGTLPAPLMAPEFTHAASGEWINSAPLTLASLRGKVVFVDFWTFECWNCYRSFPWLKGMEARLEPEGLQVIGVHSPEFDREKVRDNIVAKVKEFGLKHPVMIDTDFSYWNAMGNRYWPAYFAIDRHGNIRAVFAGETHDGDEQAKEIESTLRTLLAEK